MNGCMTAGICSASPVTEGPIMTRTLLIRGMLVGILAGLLVFAFAKLFVEPEVDLAIAFEDHVHQLAGDAPEPEIGSRTALYFGMIVISIVAMVAAVNLGRGLLARLGTWNAVIAAAAVYVVVVAIAGYVMPPVNEGPAAFSAVVLWNFRLAS